MKLNSNGLVVMVRGFNATFNISAISWQSVFFGGVPGENHRQTSLHNVVSSTPRLSGIRTHNVSGDSTDSIGSYKSNYHTIMITTAP